MGLASCYPLDLFHLSDILFLTIGSMSGVVFPFLFTGGHRSRRILRPQISATIIQLSQCFVQVFFNQLMISLFFCIQIPSSLLVFSNSSRWFSLFHQSFSNSYGGSFKILFLDYHSIHSFLSNHTGGSRRLSQVWCYPFSSLWYVTLNPFQEE